MHCIRGCFSVLNVSVKKSNARHHQDSVRRGVRRSQLHSASAEAAKAPYPLPPSSFPNCDRFAGSQFGDTRALPVSEFSFFSSPGAAVLFFLRKRKKRMGAQRKRADRVVRPYKVRRKSRGRRKSEGSAEKRRSTGVNAPGAFPFVSAAAARNGAAFRPPAAPA